MTIEDDIDAMASIGEAMVDKGLKGHSDKDLANLYTANKGLYRSETKGVMTLWGLIGQLIKKVYDLENPE